MKTHIKEEPIVGRRGESSKKASKRGFMGVNLSSWGIWIICFCFSIVALLFVPLTRFLRHEDFTGVLFFISIFGNVGIMAISASVAVSAAFEGIAKSKGIAMGRAILIALAFICYFILGYKTYYTSEFLILRRILPINILLFGSVFILSMWSFSSLNKSSSRSGLKAN